MRLSWIQTGWMNGLLCGVVVGLGVVLANEGQAQHIRLHDVIRSALADNPSLHVEKEQVRLSEGVWHAALGQFDPQLLVSLAGSRAHEPQMTAELLRNVTTDASTYSLALQKQFQSGLTITPEVLMSRRDNLPGGGTLNSARVGLSLAMPLLRDRGVGVNAAEARAARHTYEASRLDFQHRRANVMLQATLAYWSYLAAWQRREAYRESEERARTLMAETEVLIAAEERPAADLKQLEANLAAKTAQRIAAEQRLFEAEQQLGLAMGLPFEQMRALGQPLDAFPTADDGILAQVLNNEPFIALAQARRTDLVASQARERAAGALLHSAQNDLKPRLDLTVDLGYEGLEAGRALEQYFTPFGRNVGGANVGVTLRYSAPFGNRSAEGLAVQRASAYQQQVTVARDLDRFIQSSVLVALKALERSIYELKSSDTAIDLYRTAVGNEKKKFQMSLATLIDVIDVEDRLTEAMLSYIDGQQRYANALVQLRYETGTLAYPTEQSFDLERLTTVPAGQEP